MVYHLPCLLLAEILRKQIFEIGNLRIRKIIFVAIVICLYISVLEGILSAALFLKLNRCLENGMKMTLF